MARALIRPARPAPIGGLLALVALLSPALTGVAHATPAVARATMATNGASPALAGRGWAAVPPAARGIVARALGAHPLNIDPEFEQLTELTGPDATANDEFGEALAVQGRTIVVGNPGLKVGPESGVGAVYVYEEGPNGWAGTTLKAELTASDATASTDFGHGVGISGQTIVAGAYESGSYVGAAYVYSEPAGGWENATQTAELTPSDGANGDKFGTSVAISGSTVVVGAVRHDASAGALYVFTEPAGGWATVHGAVVHQTAELTASDGAPEDALGYSVAASGSTVIGGAERHGEGKGAVYVFTEPAGGWVDTTQTAELTASNGVAGDGLGYSVGMSGSTIVAGAEERDGDRGAAYVFTEPAGGWQTTDEFAAELTSSNSEPDDELGNGVAVYKNTVVAGAPFRNEDEGTAYVFIEPAGGWASTSEPTAELTPSNGEEGNEFGYTVAAGGPVVVGALHADGNLGSAYLFHPIVTSSTMSLSLSPSSIPADGHSTTTGTLTVKDTSGNPVAGESFEALSTNHRELFGPVHETSTPGTYAVTIISSTTPGSATITLRDTSVSPAASASATLTETPIATSSSAPSNAFAVIGRRVNADGMITVDVKVPGAGIVNVLGTHENIGASASALLEPGPGRFDWGRAAAAPAKAGVVKLTLRPNGAGRHLLLRHRRHGWALHVRFWVTYTPSGGTPRSTVSTARVLAARRR